MIPEAFDSMGVHQSLAGQVLVGFAVLPNGTSTICGISKNRGS